MFSYLSQVLLSVLSSRKNMSDSLAYGRFHPQLEPDTLLVDCKFFFYSFISTFCEFSLTKLCTMHFVIVLFFFFLYIYQFPFQLQFLLLTVAFYNAYCNILEPVHLCNRFLKRIICYNIDDCTQVQCPILSYS